MAFRCSANHSQYLPCENGGLCTLDESRGEVCSCSEGWTADFIGLGHFPNCAVPVGFLPTFFIVYTAAFWLIMLVTLYKFSRVPLKGKMKTLTVAAILWSFSCWVHILCVYIQGGFFEAALVSFTLIGIIGYWVASYTIPLLLVPLAKRARRNWVAAYIAAFTRFFFFVQCFISFALLGAALYSCRDPNPTLYNQVMILTLAEQCCAVLVGSLWALFVARRLNGFLPQTAFTVKHQVRVIAVMAMLLVASSLTNVGLICVWMFQGSVPYMWITWLVMNCVMLWVLISQAMLIKSLGLYSSPTTATTIRVKAEDLDQNSTASSNILAQPAQRGLGIQGQVALKWKKKHHRQVPMKQLTRVTEAEEVTTMVESTFLKSPLS